jgi:hypothetical protein
VIASLRLTRLQLTPWCGTPGRASARPIRTACRSSWRPRPKPSNISTRTREFSLNASEDPRSRALGAGGGRPRAGAGPAARVCGISRFGRAHVRRDSPHERSVPGAEDDCRELWLVQEPDRRGAKQDRSVRRGERQCEPGAGALAHALAEAAGAAAVDARILSEGEGHLAVSAGPGRQRPRRALRAGRQGRASLRDSRNHPRQFGRAAPEFVEPPESRSTTRSSRSNSRSGKKSIAFSGS